MNNSEWHAYCITCNSLIFKANNGEFVEGAAKRHLKEEENHKVIVGLKYENTESEEKQ